ncbi:hypothetical protein [Flavimaricola marinus]|uniref:DUF1579 domain-containing protein n=1 Tax=Flavimaricola marinus TaxID=1819565 RepID=A0A238LAL7_9RHOB|nr:hypothetical protein [Flavimaricola marinus]SMY06719.1 hypothetical protein LOM8899_00848 [Flavimaricola marinus]
MQYAYEGSWELVPELSHYDEGKPPKSGRYVITQTGDEIHFQIEWVEADGTPHLIDFKGVADGAIRPAGEEGIKASFHRKGKTLLESRAYQAGQEVSYAFRRASDDGSLLSVIQFYKHPDGTRTMRLQTYRRAER